MATMTTISPEEQEALGGLALGAERDLAVELNDREPVPEPGALRRLDSAGLRFEIRDPAITGRTVRMRLVKRQ
jgi:hypothetical protein